MTVAPLDEARQRYLDVRGLEDGGGRGAATRNAYVAGLRDYGEALLEEGAGLAPQQREALEVGLGAVELALAPPHRPQLVDKAVQQLRVAVDAADAAEAPRAE